MYIENKTTKERLNMKALVLSNNKFETREIKNTLEDLQEIVGGYIEIPYLSDVFNENGIDIVINEEGKFIDGLKAEIAVIDGETKQILDVVFGNCIFVSHDEEGETTELTEEQMKVVMRELRMDVVLSYENGNTFTTKALFI
jgi:hypothetical protein